MLIWNTNQMESMTAPTGRKMFFLTDPIENWPRDWADYKKNYQATFTAQLLYPHIADYEVMPWPERIYEGFYRTCANCEEKERIPRFYSTQMQVMINALNKMPLSDKQLTGNKGISVLMANSLMFQRFPIHDGYEDPQLANFYGLALPLLKRGVPVKTVHMENLKYKETLAETKVLLMTYSNMKPLEPEAHKYLAEWVKKRGVLIFSGTDKDRFQTVKEWWNTGENNYATPSTHLFEMLGLPDVDEGEYKCGKGTVCVVRTDPKDFIIQEGGDKKFLNLVSRVYEKNAKGGNLKFKNSFYLERGAYDLVAVLEESVSEAPFVVEGCLIDLFDPALPVVSAKQVCSGEQAFLLDINRLENKKQPRGTGFRKPGGAGKKRKRFYAYVAKSPSETSNISRVLLPSCPRSVRIDGKEDFKAKNWDKSSNTYLIEFENNPNGVHVRFEW